jgi:hypothetical protein
MKEERMKILQMVEDGKISIEEAGKLLEALKASHGPCFDDDFCGKFEEFCENSESAIGNFVKTAVSKTAGLVDDLGKALSSFLKGFADECEEDDCGCECCREEEAKEEESKEN